MTNLGVRKGFLLGNDCKYEIVKLVLISHRDNDNIKVSKRCNRLRTKFKSATIRLFFQMPMLNKVGVHVYQIVLSDT